MPSIVLEDEKTIRIDNSCTLILKSSNVNIEYDLKDGEYSVLIFNDVNSDLNLNETGKIENAEVKINYLELNDYNLKQLSKVDVLKNSTLKVNATYLGVNTKNIVFDLYNKESDSLIDINNNIVCLDKADFKLDCIGTIVKGSKRAKCHQASHCLTLGNPKKAEVLPVLNIDENDVEASHSLSSGTIDEEILFYMNSRGLSANEALNLILRSYLMPNDHYYDEFIDGKNIQEKAIKKVDEICSI